MSKLRAKVFIGQLKYPEEQIAEFDKKCIELGSCKSIIKKHILQL